MRRAHVWMATIFLLISLSAVAQQSVEVTVPPMVNFSGVLSDVNGKPLTGVVGVIFYLYKDQQGGAPLWVETQNAQPDKTGRYSVMLGSTTSQGLPADLFASGEARWLGVQAQGQEEQPRVMLLSVPYAMKAVDAQTIGGLPPSAFVLAAPPSASAGRAIATSKAAASVTPETSHDVTTTGGTVNTIPLFTTSTSIQNSILTQTGTTAVNIDGNLNLPATGRFEVGGKLFAFGSYAKQNAFLGFAGNTSTTGTYNTGLGYEALKSNTTGSFNDALGFQALYSNTTGYDNIANGFQALNYNTTGTDNTADGYRALLYTTGNYNAGFGSQALYNNTTGSENTAIGYAALNNNSIECCNTAVGTQALASSNVVSIPSGLPNDAFGYQALYNNTTGFQNAAFGYQTLYSATTGDSNSAFGFQAMSNAYGYNNAAFGYQALYGSTKYVVQDSSAFGFQALYSNTDGTNDAFGFRALYNNTGSLNTAFGYVALQNNTSGQNNAAFGEFALSANTTGSSNTGIGEGALAGNTTGSELTCIGAGCTAPANVSNATAIGAHAVVGQSNSLVLGGTGQYSVKVGIGTTTPSNVLTVGRGTGHPVSDSWETYSSRRWKTNIHPLQNALSKVEQLRGVSYDLKDSGEHEIGVIAEEVGKVVPEVVSYEDNGKDARGVDYSRLTALLIEATKEQQALIRKQQQQIRAQQAQLKAQRSQIKAQQAQGQIQQAQIVELLSEVKAIQASLKTNGHSGAEVRTVKAQVPVVQQ